MPKIGVISDVHGDPLALELAWSHLLVQGADAVVCAGDVVGYGPFPDRAVALLQQWQIPTVMGNHDRWALLRPPGETDPCGGATPSEASLEYLRTLPFDRRFERGSRSIAMVHGSPNDDMEFVTRERFPPRALRGLLDMVAADVLIVGHTHVPMWFRCDRGLVLNPGSLISVRPMKSTSRTFAMLELDDLSVTFHDVESGEPVSVAPWPDTPDTPDPQGRLF